MFRDKTYTSFDDGLPKPLPKFLPARFPGPQLPDEAKTRERLRKFLRFFRHENLRSTRRRSASCPNLTQQSLEDDQNKITHSSSESDEEDRPNKFERLTAQRSTKRVWLKEKEKKENTEKNLISMDDYLGKLSDLKTWLKEERKKDVDTMRSPKLKTHFKTFVKLWNKRKLPAKYYRGCSVDLSSEEQTSCATLYSNMAEQPMTPQYALVEESCKHSIPNLPPPFDLSSYELVNDPGSPFSTFGKSGDVLTSPTILTEQVNILKHSRVHKYETFSTNKPSPVKSPPKFATISRSIPAISRLNKFTAQPWTSSENVKVYPMPGSRYPLNHNPAASFTRSPTVSGGVQKLQAEPDQEIYSLAKPVGSSPVYSTIIDAIPYSTGSPKYAEIEESIPSPLHRQPSSGYCSVSPFKISRPPYTEVKPAVSKKQSMNRRRSKSLEDLYSIPYKTGSSGNVKCLFITEDMETSTTPPIPDRKYSPFAAQSKSCISPPKTSCSKLSSPPGTGLQKRQSPEGIETAHIDITTPKKARSAWSSKSLLHNDVDEDSVSSLQESEDALTSTISILTGSLNATTRSKYKLQDNLASPECSTARSSEPRLSILEIKQLEESPKMPRRRLKRRSSSFSTTPGKGLIFGKSSKMSAASPRRVSFAKNVKDTENKTPKSVLSYKTPVTRQTLDRKDFETFLSSHNSPPRKSNSPNKPPSPRKSNSPNKVPSPDKSSTLNSSSPSKKQQKYFHENITPVSAITCEDQNPMPKKNKLVSREENKTDSSQPDHSPSSDTFLAERIFPESQTRQVGRRVIGAPRASPVKKFCDIEVNSVDKNVESTPVSFPAHRNVPDSSQVVFSRNNPMAKTLLASQKYSGSPKKLALSWSYSPQKYIGTTPKLDSPQKYLGITAKLDSPQKYLGTTPKLDSPQKFLGTTPKLDSPQKYLGTTPKLDSPQKYLGTTAKLDSPQKYLGTTAKLDSPQKYLGTTAKLDSPQKYLGTTAKLDSPQKYLGTTAKLDSPQKYLGTTAKLDSPQKYLGTTAKLDSSQSSPSGPPNMPTPKQKDLVSPKSSPTKKLLDLPLSLATSKTSIQSLVSKLTEKTSTICAQELSESDDCLSSDELNNGLPLPNILRTHDSKPDFSTILPEQESQNLHEPNKDFKLASLDGSPGSKKRELFDHLQRSSTTFGTELPSVKHPNSNLYKYSETLEPAAVYESECVSLVPPIIMDEKSTPSLETMDIDKSIQGSKVTSLLPVKETYDCGHAKSSTSSLRMVVKGSVSSGLKVNKSVHVSENVTKTLQSFPLPFFDLAAEFIQDDYKRSHDLSRQEIVSYLSDTDGSGRNLEYENHKTNINDGRQEILTSDNTILMKADFVEIVSATDNQENIKPVSATGNQENINPASAVNQESINESLCDLKRLSSIRASPKIVDNDGWITERRRSSRGRNLPSFRSAYNRYLLKTSSKEEEEMKDDQSEKTTPTLTSFVDIKTETTQQSLESDTTLHNDVTARKKIEPYYKTKQILDSNIGLKPAVKTKPQILPKPSKASPFVTRKPNITNDLISSFGKTTSKRRSSLAKTKPVMTKSSTQENTYGHVPKRTVKCNDEFSSDKNKTHKRVSSGKYKTGIRKSAEQNKCVVLNESKVSEAIDLKVPVQDSTHTSFTDLNKESKKPCSSTERLSTFQKTGQTTRKRSSNGARDSLSSRRRSKGKGVNEENKIPSFAERRNFFSKLNAGAHSNVRKTKGEIFGQHGEVKYSPQKSLQLKAMSCNEEKNCYF